MPHDFFGSNHSAEIEIHPSGKFLYESNRRTMSETEGAPDTIGVFAIDPRKGCWLQSSSLLTGGVMPRSFTIDPTGKYLLAANQISTTWLFTRSTAPPADSPIPARRSRWIRRCAWSSFRGR